MSRCAPRDRETIPGSWELTTLLATSGSNRTPRRRPDAGAAAVPPPHIRTPAHRHPVRRRRAYRRFVAASRDRERIRDEVIPLGPRTVDVPQLGQEAIRVLRRSIPFDGTCLLTMDPATLLPTGDVAENALSASATVRLTEIELREPDVNKFTHLARGRLHAAALAQATGGELDRSTRHRELRRPSGFDDELRVVLTGATGTWGALTLLREAGRPRFTPAETQLMASLAAPLAEGI